MTFNSTNAERTGYPNQKPEKLIEPFILVHTSEGDLVVDPFAGSGTVGAVAKRLGRKYLMIDVNLVAIKTMQKRLEIGDEDVWELEQ